MGRGRNAWALGLAAVAAAACSADAAGALDVATDRLAGERIELVRSARLPLEGMSGLGARGTGAARSGLAIADHARTLLTFDLDGPLGRVERRDLDPLFGSGASQWEAVAGDGAGRVFLLGERQSMIWVLDPALREVLHVLELDVGGGSLGEDWASDDNSRGEGLVLLRNGHVLVAKEKRPAAIVELAPAGEPARGFSSALALGERAFRLPAGDRATFRAVAHWKLSATDAARLGDLSDLAVDDAGRLFALSDQGRAVIRVEDLDPADRQLTLGDVVPLPRRIDKPEGLLVLADRTLVLSDANPRDDAFFELTALR